MIGLITGTGLGELPGMTLHGVRDVATAYGSSMVEIGAWNGCPVARIYRHGAAHSRGVRNVAYQANLLALHHLGIQFVLATNAVGTFRPLASSPVCVLRDLIDLDSAHSPPTFFTRTPVHVDFSEPYSRVLRDVLTEAAHLEGIATWEAIYAGRGGPRFESPAELRMLQSVGADVVGLTSHHETPLARELNLHYAALGLVSNAVANAPVNLSAAIRRGLVAVVPDACEVLRRAVSIATEIAS